MYKVLFNIKFYLNHLKYVRLLGPWAAACDAHDHLLHQGSEHDAPGRGPPLWPDDRGVTDQRLPVGAANDDGVSDAEDATAQLPERPAGQVQERLPDGPGPGRGGDVQRPAAGCGLL